MAEYFIFPPTHSSPDGQLLTQTGAGIGKVISIATTNNDVLTLTLAVLSMTALVVAFNLTVWRRIYHFATKRYAYNR